MKIIPEHPDLRKHIEYFWIVKDTAELFTGLEAVYDFPGTSPEMVFLLDGEFNYFYHGNFGSTRKSTLISHIDSFFQLIPNKLKSFIVVRFRSKSLSALLPFTSVSPSELLKNPIVAIEEVLNIPVQKLINRWIHLTAEEIASELEELFFAQYNRDNEGFVTELFQSKALSHSTQNIYDVTHFSPSTLFRYFKKETGISPKYFLSLRRFRESVNLIYETNNQDWISYVEAFDYYDQSHFIKEIKRFSSFTPSQLIQLNSLEKYRPI